MKLTFKISKFILEIFNKKESHSKNWFFVLIK
jgi:hypothetical protein